MANKRERNEHNMLAIIIKRNSCIKITPMTVLSVCVWDVWGLSCCRRFCVERVVGWAAKECQVAWTTRR